MIGISPYMSLETSCNTVEITYSKVLVCYGSTESNEKVRNADVSYRYKS